MDKNKKNRQLSDEQEEIIKRKKDSEKLDEELDQTFPASDPPTHTRPEDKRKEREAGSKGGRQDEKRKESESESKRSRQDEKKDR